MQEIVKHTQRIEKTMGEEGNSSGRNGASDLRVVLGLLDSRIIFMGKAAEVLGNVLA
jgi:hypothetical protein